MRAVIATKEKLSGQQRKLGWFSRQGQDLYFDFCGIFWGSHTSYHQDGNIFRTSPATRNRPELVDRHLPLKNFAGWYQLGTGMIKKDRLSNNPPVKKSDFSASFIELSLDDYPSDTINIVLELIEPRLISLLKKLNLASPKDAEVQILKFQEPWVILTVLGHEHNLLLKPIADGFRASHFNSRYTTNAPGVQYSYEAYRPERIF
ncbi:MAG: hypothetical protein HYW38_02085 [Candidatus Colwellbacteria bacterium]|nr:hypothetical protein [Candidatus Colwellbacteria bacterium]